MESSSRFVVEELEEDLVRLSLVLTDEEARSLHEWITSTANADPDRIAATVKHIIDRCLEVDAQDSDAAAAPAGATAAPADAGQSEEAEDDVGRSLAIGANILEANSVVEVLVVWLEWELRRRHISGR